MALDILTWLSQVLTNFQNSLTVIFSKNPKHSPRQISYRIRQWKNSDSPATAPKMKFLGQGFQKLEHQWDRQTERPNSLPSVFTGDKMTLLSGASCQYLLVVHNIYRGWLHQQSCKFVLDESNASEALSWGYTLTCVGSKLRDLVISFPCRWWLHILT